MRMFTALMVVVLIALASPLAAQDPQKERPTWWPEPGTRPFGLDWPPPRPDGWPQNRPWPPPAAEGEDPEFWTELWGEDPNPAQDPRFGMGGKLGNDRFRYNFRRLYDLDGNVHPGCGLHVLSMGRFAVEQSCTPFPANAVRQHCAIAFDEQRALQKCRQHCQRNPRELRCRGARLMKPPFEAYWRCTKFGCFDHLGEPAACAQPWYQSDCYAFYLCDCMDI